MDTAQIICTLRNVDSFLGVFSSDLLPRSITRSGTLIVNTDPHTEKGSHWVAINFQTKSYSVFFFDSFCLFPFVYPIQSLLRRSCTIWDLNTTQLQGLTSSVCRHYCCLFALYMDRGYTLHQFISLFHPNIADRQVKHMFHVEFGPLRKQSHGGQCCTCFNMRYVYAYGEGSKCITNHIYCPVELYHVINFRSIKHK
jgi:hypothetical protein